MEFDGTFEGYQNAARSTAIYPDKQKQFGLLYTVLGLTGEAGEVANTVKKLLRDTEFINTNDFNQEFLEKITGEVGDVLWYIANLCEELNITMEDVAVANLVKLYSRKERGVLKGSGDNR